jgi:hypothetical protein
MLDCLRLIYRRQKMSQEWMICVGQGLNDDLSIEAPKFHGASRPHCSLHQYDIPEANAGGHTRADEHAVREPSRFSADIVLETCQIVIIYLDWRREIHAHKLT